MSKRKTNEQGQVVCPRCGSISITYNKKGFSVAKVIVLTICTLGIFGIFALFAGLIGRKKVIAQCAACGKKWSV